MTKAEEFATYMAKSAQQYMYSTNDLLMAMEYVDCGEMHEDDLQSFRDSHTDALRGLQSAIYEFSKRLPK